MPNWKTPLQEIPVGQGRCIKSGEEVAILTLGHIGNYAVAACESLHAIPLDFRASMEPYAPPLSRDLRDSPRRGRRNFPRR